MLSGALGFLGSLLAYSELLSFVPGSGGCCAKSCGRMGFLAERGSLVSGGLVLRAPAPGWSAASSATAGSLGLGALRGWSSDLRQTKAQSWRWPLRASIAQPSCRLLRHCKWRSNQPVPLLERLLKHSRTWLPFQGCAAWPPTRASRRRRSPWLPGF